ncbi:mce related protein [bacterium BMS3Abin05]|nr:mce related protein [bacterium BMS3Abin05]GBE26954.1 mce related protein [bacterium BMS3Bbin03]HDZ11200.1 MCE family protein [Bacteroidota bacterium]
MNIKSPEVEVGLFVVLGLFILFFGIIWAKGYSFSANKNSISIVFNNASGLEEGNPVTVNGVRKGKVKQIVLMKNQVLVKILLSKEVVLYQNARASIEMTELMGGKCVEISPGDQEPPLDLKHLKSPLIGAYTPSIPELIGLAGSLAKQAHEVLGTFKTTLDSTIGNSNIQKSFRNSVHNIEYVSNQLSDFVRKNTKEMQISVNRLNESAKRINNLVVVHTADIDTTLTQLKQFSLQLNTFTGSLKDLTNQLRNKKGTLAKLIYNEDVFNKFQSSANNLDSISTNLKHNLGKYLQGANFQLFKIF